MGPNTAVLCRSLDATLVFVDFDKVESKNLLAQAYVKQSLGKNKAEALKLQLLNFHGVKAEAFGVVELEYELGLCTPESLYHFLEPPESVLPFVARKGDFSIHSFGKLHSYF